MKLDQALTALGAAAIGLTSLIAAPESTIPEGQPIGAAGPWTKQAIDEAHKTAGARIEALKDQMADCHSDAAYWGYAAQLANWRAVQDILLAASRVGADNLPDVPPPANAGVVMDIMKQQERFGSEVLSKAMRMPLPQGQGQPIVEIEMPMGAVGPNDPVPEGYERKEITIDGEKLSKVANAFIDLARGILHLGEDRSVIKAAILYTAGYLMAIDGVHVDPQQSIGAGVGPLVIGYQHGMEAHCDGDENRPQETGD